VCYASCHCLYAYIDGMCGGHWASLQILFALLTIAVFIGFLPNSQNVSGGYI